MNWKIFTFKLINSFILVSNKFVSMIVEQSGQNQERLINLLANNVSMNNIKNIIFNGFKVFLHKAKLFKFIKFINQPSHHVDKPLHFTYKLVSQIDFFQLLFIDLRILNLEILLFVILFLKKVQIRILF